MITAPPTVAQQSGNGKAPPLAIGHIPAELRALLQWVCWRYENDDNGKPTKKPFRPNGRYASSTTPATWNDFQTVLKAAHQFDGIGIVCAAGLAGVDLDHCIDDAGNLTARARAIVDRMDTYTEVTPSGEGVRCLFFGELPGDGIPANNLNVEMYDSGRYFTVTGNHLEGTPWTVEHRTQQAGEIYAETKAALEPPNPLAELVVAAAALAQRAPEAIRWMVHGIFECGELVLITAPPGMMKSLLILHMMACIAAARNWLARPAGNGLVTQTARVLWVNTDNGQATHENRLVAILHTLRVSDIPLFSITTTDFELKNPKDVKNLHLLADDLAADVIVLDTLSGCLTGVNENSAEEMTAPAAHLRALAGNGRTVIGIHHPPKNDAEGSRGSSVLPGKVDRHFTVARRGDMLTIKPAKVRNSPSMEFTVLAAIETDPTTGALTGVNFFDGKDELEVRELSAAKDRVLAALKDGPLPSMRALRKAAKGRGEVIDEAVDLLLLAGLIETTKGPRNSIIYSLKPVP